jgi:alpha-D-ribose 1-methylphosphonate 5-triphosphate diphosphatase PhnM
VWARRHEAATLEEALVAASRMTATNAARLTGLDRQLGAGSIADGRAADLILARLTGRAGNWHLDISRTWIAGREAYRRPGR